MEGITEAQAVQDSGPSWVKVVTEVPEPNMWVVLARRCTNKGTRFEHTEELPTFYLDSRVQGITNRAHARRIAGEILGADMPGSDIHFDVHRV